MIWNRRYEIMKQRIAEEKQDRKAWRKTVEQKCFGSVCKWRRIHSDDPHHKIFAAVESRRSMPGHYTRPVYVEELDRIFVSMADASRCIGISQTAIRQRVFGVRSEDAPWHIRFLTPSEIDDYLAGRQLKMERTHTELPQKYIDMLHLPFQTSDDRRCTVCGEASGAYSMCAKCREAERSRRNAKLR